MMMNNDSMERSLFGMRWETVQYTKSEIKAAGKAIEKNDYERISREQALEIANNWRAAHAYPLQVFYMNAKRYSEEFSEAIVAQRLKRLDSIVGKLQRSSGMNLYKMQDLGGCRVIVKTISEVYQVKERFLRSAARHVLEREYDYIAQPKQSGYRSLHMVYSYKTKGGKKTYDGMFIELQIRTYPQHLWATAVEILSLPMKTNLKAEIGDSRVLRYMELVSALFAIEERMPLSQYVPQDASDIVDEITTLEDTNVLDIMDAMNITLASKHTTQKSKQEAYYLLKINTAERKVYIKSFRKKDLEVAIGEYAAIEDNSDEQINAVLVSSENINSLRKAYPNYFADTKKFVSAVEILLKKYFRSDISSP